jgi:membrane protease YdiL (CAAX protease family)
VLLTIVFVVGVALALQILFSLVHLTDVVTALAKSKDVRLSALSMIIPLVIIYGATIVALALWVTFGEKRQFWTIGLQRKGALVKYVRGMLIGIAMYAIAIGVLALTGSVRAIPGAPGQVGLGALAGVLLVFPAWAVQGASEEVIARGWLLPTMGVRYRPWIGVLIPTIMFAVLHLPDFLATGFNALAVLSLLVVSLFLSAYALSEQSLWGVLGFHAAWNWAEGNLLASQVSGNSAGGGALVKLTSIGPTWMTGGSFGPEAGLPVITVGLIGLVGILLFARYRTSSRVEAAKLADSQPDLVDTH